jgi:hypothetical protein
LIIRVDLAINCENSSAERFGESAGVMDAEERVFDDDEKQRAWLEGCRSEEAISRLLERHGDKHLSIKAALARVSANPAVLQDLRRATLLRGQRNFDRFYREANFEPPPTG